ncbi:hypothetical protein [Chryseolinea lacunae]|uniref:Outer membrane protein beta-barrel domain-containing protein n=1 Tax=Chryseolinea lacunae TaxID=2801331 RepID=A0ABS1KWY2_9BACT|nr:hypothetical protein [Chryseolinea lacunae]MBL0743813.1 hypothetical protein [Chryseolinea lacunae]
MLHLPAVAQSDSTKREGRKIRYYNNFLSGALIGGSGQEKTSFSFATTHGIRVKRLSVGLGVEYDSYGPWKVVPLFATASVDVVRLKSSAFFVQGVGGYSPAHYTQSENRGYSFVDGGGGVMTSALAGYRFSAEKFSMYISGGYRYQQNDFTYADQFYSYTDFYYEPPHYSVKEKMERFVIQLGFGWH